MKDESKFVIVEHINDDPTTEYTPEINKCELPDFKSTPPPPASDKEVPDFTNTRLSDQPNTKMEL